MPITLHDMKSFIRWTQSRTTGPCTGTTRSVKTFNTSGDFVWKEHSGVFWHSKPDHHLVIHYSMFSFVNIILREYFVCLLKQQAICIGIHGVISRTTAVISYRPENLTPHTPHPPTSTVLTRPRRWHDTQETRTIVECVHSASWRQA
jgi:hypothetical protein